MSETQILIFTVAGIVTIILYFLVFFKHKSDIMKETKKFADYYSEGIIVENATIEEIMNRISETYAFSEIKGESKIENNEILVKSRNFTHHFTLTLNRLKLKAELTPEEYSGIGKIVRLWDEDKALKKMMEACKIMDGLLLNYPDNKPTLNIMTYFNAEKVLNINKIVKVFPLVIVLTISVMVGLQVKKTDLVKSYNDKKTKIEKEKQTEKLAEEAEAAEEASEDSPYEEEEETYSMDLPTENVAEESQYSEEEAVEEESEEGYSEEDSEEVGEEPEENQEDNNYYSSKDFILPYSDSEYISEEVISRLSPVELRIARNEIYARHGRKFKDKELRDYFNNFQWYRDLPKVKEVGDDELNDYEIENIKTIQSYE